MLENACTAIQDVGFMEEQRAPKPTTTFDNKSGSQVCKAVEPEKVTLCGHIFASILQIELLDGLIDVPADVR